MEEDARGYKTETVNQHLLNADEEEDRANKTQKEPEIKEPKLPKKPGVGNRDAATGRIIQASDNKALIAHSKRCIENCKRALLEDTFAWTKPEPFRHLGAPQQVESTEQKRRLRETANYLEGWESLESRTLQEFRDLIYSTEVYNIDDEVEARDFVWRDRKVHWERFVKVDLKDAKDPFRDSRIYSKVEEKWTEYEKNNPRVPEDLIKMRVAKDYRDADLSDKKKAAFIGGIFAEMYGQPSGNWRELMNEAEAAMKTDNLEYPSAELFQRKFRYINDQWPRWTKTKKDKKYQDDRNIWTAAEKNGVLRRPSYNGDSSAIYIAVDREDRLIIFLDPDGIQAAFGNESVGDSPVIDKLGSDAHEFYSHYKIPREEENVRHTSQQSLLDRNIHLKAWECGSDHYGTWHETGGTQRALRISSDCFSENDVQMQAIRQFLDSTGGCITRVLDFWFGVWEPDLRARYRQIYRDAPKHARLPPVNEGHEETYTLRVTVCNRPTDEHHDNKDMRGGLTGLCQLGDFEGSAMCINKLGIALDGYKNGAILLFCGTELDHYISEWNGKYRYAFDHTTHQSVADMVDFHNRNKPYWVEKKHLDRRLKPDEEAANRTDKGGDPDEDGSGDETKPEKQAGPAAGPSKATKPKRKKKDEGDGEDQPPKKRKTGAGKNATRGRGGKKAEADKKGKGVDNGSPEREQVKRTAVETAGTDKKGKGVDKGSPDPEQADKPARKPAAKGKKARGINDTSPDRGQVESPPKKRAAPGRKAKGVNDDPADPGHDQGPPKKRTKTGKKTKDTNSDGAAGGRDESRPSPPVTRAAARRAAG
ncbi:hypothetical protein ACLMJK_001949 [Lecanora helva]